MILEQLIAPSIPILHDSDTGSKALAIMEENKCILLPLVKDEQYVALVRESDLLNAEHVDAPLSATNFLGYRPAVHATVHPYEALRVMHQQNLCLLPVIDNDNNYLGSITHESLLAYIMENSGLDNPGGIIVLEVAPRNYTLYEIARICENEDVTIINSQLFTNKATGKLEVTIKTNRTDLEAVVNSFERHNYKVLDVYGELANKEDMESKYALLMNYINM